MTKIFLIKFEIGPKPTSARNLAVDEADDEHNQNVGPPHSDSMAFH